MARGGIQWLESLEKWRGAAFTVAGVIFLADAVLLAWNVAMGTEQFMTLGQAFVGAGWTAAFVGLLGLYPSLADRSRWLSRIGVVFAVVGGITMAAMAVASIAYVADVPSGQLSDVAMFFLPGVFLGIVLGFGAFAVACLRTDVYAPSVGILFVLLPVTFLFNLGTGIAGFNPLSKVLGVVVVLVLVTLTIGYLFRTDGALAHRGRLDASGGQAT